VKEPFDSSNAEYIKSQIREKISRASAALVYLSEKCPSSKWVDWEIRETIRQGKKVIGMYKGARPPCLPSAFTEMKLKVVPWQHDAIMKAIS